MTTVTLQRNKRKLRPTKKGEDRYRKVWQLRWYGTDGRRYCETIGDAKTMAKRDAEAVRREKQTDFDSDRENPVAPDKVTVSDLVEQYIAAHASTWYIFRA